MERIVMVDDGTVMTKCQKYTPLFFCMNYSKELDWRRGKVINSVFRCILAVFKQDGGGPVQQVS